MDCTRISMMVAEAIALCCIFRRRQLKKRPALFLFLATGLLMDLRAIHITDARSIEYINLYCENAFLIGLIQAGIAIELYRITLSRYPGLGWVGRAFGAISLAVALVIGMGAIEPAMHISWRMGVMQAAFLWRMATAVAMSTFVAMLAVGTRALKNQFSRNYYLYRKCAIGFGMATALLYSCSLWGLLPPILIYWVMLAVSVGLSVVVMGMTRGGETVTRSLPTLTPEDIERMDRQRDELINALEKRSRSPLLVALSEKSSLRD